MADNGSEKKAVEKILTGLFDGTDPKDYKNVPGLKFYDEKKGFQTYQEFDKANTPVTAKNIGIVSITVDGKTRAFKKIVQNEATDDKAIAEVTSKSVDKSASGLKATAWIELETDEKGSLVVDKDGKPKTVPKLTEGKAEVFLTFPGFKGNPYGDPTSQTQAALAAEQGQLYPPTADVAKFLKTVDKQLEKLGVKESKKHIAAHSFGSPNALSAAAILGDKAKDVFLQEAVTASGTLDMLKGMKPKELVENLKIPMEEAAKVVENIKRIEKKTTSRRDVDENGRLSNSAMLEVFKGDSKDPKNKQALEALHKKNMGTSIKPTWAEKAVLLLDSTLFTAKTGRDGNDPKKIDPKNEMIGTREYEFVSKEVIKENGLTALASKYDPRHSLSNSAHAEQKGAPVAPSIDKLKEKTTALPRGFDAAMVRALEQFGVGQEQIARAHDTMDRFIKGGLSGINGMVESLGRESTLTHAGKEVTAIAAKLAEAAKNDITRS